MYILWRMIYNVYIYMVNIVNAIAKFIINKKITILIVIFIVSFWIPIENHSQDSLIITTKPRALELNINGPIVDEDPYDIRIYQQKVYPSFNMNSMYTIANIINKAKSDSTISCILMNLHNFTGADQTCLEYVGKYLKDFSSCKPIYVYSCNYDQERYYLASYATQINLERFSEIDLHGLTESHIYFNRLLRIFRLVPYIFRVGIYKSATEPFTRDNMSKEDKIASLSVIQQRWNRFIETIANNRHTSVQDIFPTNIRNKLNELKMLGDSSQYALNHHMVDNICSEYEFKENLKSIVGMDESNQHLNIINMFDYITPENVSVEDNNTNIDIISINFLINRGAKLDNICHKMNELISKKNIKVVILCMNSPGGDFFSSLKIRELVILLKKSGKKIVVSMGNAATSGAYLIASAADYIIANPISMTGSIGAFNIINNFSKILNFLGIHRDGVSISPLHSIAPEEPLTPEQKEMLEIILENNYKHFVQMIAESRNKTFDQINNIAQGRIWTGKDAMDNGLIDSLGDLDDAIAKAIELGNITDSHVAWCVNYNTSNIFQPRRVVYDNSGESNDFARSLLDTFKSISNSLNLVSNSD